jgi:hypothetical protein
MLYTVKKRLATFPSPAGLSLTKLSLAVNIKIIPGQGEFRYDEIPGGDGKIANIFLQCTLCLLRYPQIKLTVWRTVFFNLNLLGRMWQL